MASRRSTYRVPARVARAGGHPELAGRTLRRVRQGGTTRYEGVRGELRGQTFSRSLVERLRNLGAEMEVTPQAYRAAQVRRLQEEHGLTYREAQRQAAIEHRDAHGAAVEDQMQRTGSSRRQAELDIREAERVLRQPKQRQTDEGRTNALRALGQIGQDEFYRGGLLVEAGLGEVA